MGGPGIVISRAAMIKLVYLSIRLSLIYPSIYLSLPLRLRPHLGKCLGTMRTTHEDVEIGRCMREKVGISCTWAYEVRATYFF